MSGNDNEQTRKGMPMGRVIRLNDLVDYGDGAVVSRTLVKTDGGTVTLFAFDAGQDLSEHTAPFDALVQVLEGRAEIAIAGKPVTVAAGEAVLMPADVPHAIHAPQRYKMILTMVRGTCDK